VERTQLGVAARAPRPDISPEALRQVIAAQMAAAEGGDAGPGLSVAELLLNMSHFGMGSSPDTSGAAEQDDPELREALSRSMRESEAESKLPPPASRRAVARLPTRRWRASRQGRADEEPEDTCCVCSELYKEGEEVTWMPCSAQHVFHASCLRPWLQVIVPQYIVYWN
jgi:hypothetical protein